MRLSDDWNIHTLKAPEALHIDSQQGLDYDIIAKRMAGLGNEFCTTTSEGRLAVTAGCLSSVLDRIKLTLLRALRALA